VKKQWLICLGLAIFMWGCSDTEPNEGPDREMEPPMARTLARFDLASGNPADIPIPNDILRSPATGQLNLPLEGEPFESANSLFGFSTSAPIVIPFSGTLETSSINPGTVIVINTTTFQPVPLNLQVVTNPETGDSTVFAQPRIPMQPGATHIAMVTNGAIGLPSGLPVDSVSLMNLLKGTTSFLDENDNSRVSAFDNATAMSLEPLRVSYQSIWAAAEQVTGLSRLDIPIAFAFTTQPLFQTLPVLRARAQAENPTPTILLPVATPEAVDAFFANAGFSAVPHDAIGSMFYGSFNAPNYISNPLFGSFQGEGEALQAAGRQDITFWAALPRDPAGPVPVIIFQHGLTRSKEDIVAVANGACANGVGVIAIDIVLHGDRVFDLINNDTGAFEPDGQPDPSGSNFINLAFPRMSRDNGRQHVADLFMLTRMLTSGATDFTGDGVPEFAPVGITYLGTSLGGLVGSVFTGWEPNVTLAALNVPGGRVGSLLPNSPSISISVNAGLAANGIFPGTPDYALFFLIFQTVIDAADPFNHAPHITTGFNPNPVPTTVLVQEMENDLVVPNSATEDLVRAMGIPQVDPLFPYAGLEAVSAPHVGSGHFQFTGGAHGFLLDPSQGPTAQGQTQAFTFLLTGLQGQPTIIDPGAGAKRDNYVEWVPSAFDFEIDTRFLVYTGH